MSWKRGKLIFDFWVEIARIDTQATAAVDPAGPATEGYNKNFRAPSRGTTADGKGEPVREEQELIRIKAQVEDGTYGLRQQTFGGDMPDYAMVTIHHYRELEARGLLDPGTGRPSFRKSDRLVAIYNKKGELEQQIPENPGLFAVHVQPRSYGLARRRNLLLIGWDDRERGTRRAS